MCQSIVYHSIYDQLFNKRVISSMENCNRIGDVHHSTRTNIKRYKRPLQPMYKEKNHFLFQTVFGRTMMMQKEVVERFTIESSHVLF